MAYLFFAVFGAGYSVVLFKLQSKKLTLLAVLFATVSFSINSYISFTGNWKVDIANNLAFGFWWFSALIAVLYLREKQLEKYNPMYLVMATGAVSWSCFPLVSIAVGALLGVA